MYKIASNLISIIGGLTVIFLITESIVELDLYHTDKTCFFLALFSNIYLSAGVFFIAKETINEFKKP